MRTPPAVRSPRGVAGVLSAVTGLGLAACAVVAAAAPLPAALATSVDDLTQLLAALLAAGCCWSAGRAGRGPDRWGWWLLAAATGAWAAGQGVWSWYELVAGRAVPFPSAADVGFLAFPLLAAAGLLALPVPAGAVRSGVRDLLDALTVAGSLLVISWASSLGVTLAADSTDDLSTALGAAYPVGDVVVITVVLLVIARARHDQRRALVPLAVGLGALAVADSAFVYLTATASYASGCWWDLGWSCGFVLIAAAGTAAATTPRPRPRRRSWSGPWDGPGPGAEQVAGRVPGDATERAGEVAAEVGAPSWLWLALPHLPLGVAELVVGVQLSTGEHRAPTPEIVLGLGLLVLVVVRQFLTLADNRRLLAQLHTEREAARHQALHDPLTGLANRVLFADRVAHALTLRAPTRAHTSVVFVDLDDFKTVNDTLGHAAGDAVLTCVAGRLRAALRPQDTVARLGGDEFAVLLEAHSEPVDRIAARLGAALALPLDLTRVAGMPLAMALSVTASIGAATCDQVDDGIDAAELLSRADAAMYAAKAGGKAAWALYQAPGHVR